MFYKHSMYNLSYLCISASDNGADMHEYNTLYTCTLNQHVLTPTASACRYNYPSTIRLYSKKAPIPEKPV